MVVIAGGGLNVSIGAIGGMSAVIVGALIKRAGVPWGYAIIIAILIAVCGAFWYFNNTAWCDRRNFWLVTLLQ